MMRERERQSYKERKRMRKREREKERERERGTVELTEIQFIFLRKLRKLKREM